MKICFESESQKLVEYLQSGRICYDKFEILARQLCNAMKSIVPAESLALKKSLGLKGFANPVFTYCNRIHLATVDTSKPFSSCTYRAVLNANLSESAAAAILSSQSWELPALSDDIVEYMKARFETDYTHPLLPVIARRLNWQPQLPTELNQINYVYFLYSGSVKRKSIFKDMCYAHLVSEYDGSLPGLIRFFEKIKVFTACIQPDTLFVADGFAKLPCPIKISDLEISRAIPNLPADFISEAMPLFYPAFERVSRFSNFFNFLAGRNFQTFQNEIIGTGYLAVPAGFKLPLARNDFFQIPDFKGRKITAVRSLSICKICDSRFPNVENWVTCSQYSALITGDFKAPCLADLNVEGQWEQSQEKAAALAIEEAFNAPQESPGFSEQSEIDIRLQASLVRLLKINKYCKLSDLMVSINGEFGPEVAALVPVTLSSLVEREYISVLATNSDTNEDPTYIYLP